jgi:endonuclease YncB( thermonuclease family)
MLRAVSVLLVLLQVGVGSSWAAGKADDPATGQLTAGQLIRGSSAKVVKVIDGDTVVLDDGKEVRLVGIQAPKLPLNRPNFKEWPLAREAKDELEKLVLNQRVTLSYGGARMDRHGRTLAHLHTDDGTWAQGEMLSRGLARVYTFADNRAAAADLLALETQAREGKRGIWALNYYRVQDADGKVGPPDTYQLVEGTVVEVADVRGRFFLNFGSDFKKDFTAGISPKDARNFASAGLDPESLKGKRVRLRGWIDERNGPAMDLTHPEQVELLR